MRENNGYKPFLLLTVLFLLAAIILLIILYDGGGRTKTQTVGIVLTGGAQENGWNGANYEGAKKACESMGVRLLVREHVPEGTGECAAAVSELAAEGAGMIMLSSYAYAGEVEELTQAYPDLVFHVNAQDSLAGNLTSYFARMYQAR